MSQWNWNKFLHDKKLSILVPVYNEGPLLEKNIQTLMQEVEPFFAEYEIIIISDGSTDATNQIIAGIQHKNVRSVLLEKNKGKGYALRSCFPKVTGDFILFIDGGMELHPREIRIFLGLQAIYNADIVIGSKRHPQSNVKYPILRRLLSFILQSVLRILFDLNVTDTQVGIKLFRAEVIKTILHDLKIDGYGFDLELLVKAKRSGFNKILEAPISLDYFSKRTRNVLAEFTHVFIVGCKIVFDTIKIYFDSDDTPKT